MDMVQQAIEYTHLGISAVGGVVVIWGVAEAAWNFARLRLSRQLDMIEETDRRRERLGAHLLLSLEIFIGADIINSVVTPSWESVGILGAIVIIRTILSHFLAKEVEQTRRSAQP